MQHVHKFVFGQVFPRISDLKLWVILEKRRQIESVVVGPQADVETHGQRTVQPKGTDGGEAPLLFDSRVATRHKRNPKCMCYEVGILGPRHTMLVTCFDFLFGQLALDQETDLVGFEPPLCVLTTGIRRNYWHMKVVAHLAQCNLIGFIWMYFHPSQVSCTKIAAFRLPPSAHLSPSLRLIIAFLSRPSSCLCRLLAKGDEDCLQRFVL